jgi:hypothetical protein
MYKSVIDIRGEVSQNLLRTLSIMADKAFNNRAGQVRNMSKKPYRLSFEGGEQDFGCLELGMLALEKEKEFLPYVESWHWIDEDDPDENCDILAEMMNPVR